MPDESAYPPARDRWRFPPPPIGRGPRIAAIVAPLVAVALIAAAFVRLAALEDEDVIGYFDDERVVATVRISCARMLAEVSRVPIEGGGPERAEAVALQNQVVSAMVDRVREAIDPRQRASDRPLEAWLADWEALVEAREAWARALAGGDAPDAPEVPVDEDGEPVTTRMDLAAAGACTVPTVLVDPSGTADRAV